MAWTGSSALLNHHWMEINLAGEHRILVVSCHNGKVPNRTQRSGTGRARKPANYQLGLHANIGDSEGRERNAHSTCVRRSHKRRALFGVFDFSRNGLASADCPITDGPYLLIYDLHHRIGALGNDFEGSQAACAEARKFELARHTLEYFSLSALILAASLGMPVMASSPSICASYSADM
jgi:hypothetical protein